MTLYDWMMAKYLSKDTPRGDLAHDMHHDADFPRDDDYDRLLRYLRYRRACAECVALFKRCWRDYQKAIPKRRVLCPTLYQSFFIRISMV